MKIETSCKEFGVLTIVDVIDGKFKSHGQTYKIEDFNDAQSVARLYGHTLTLKMERNDSYPHPFPTWPTAKYKLGDTFRFIDSKSPCVDIRTATVVGWESRCTFGRLSSVEWSNG